MISAEQIKQLQQRAQVLGRCIGIDAKRAEVEEKTQKTLALESLNCLFMRSICASFTRTTKSILPSEIFLWTFGGENTWPSWGITDQENPRLQSF